MKSLGQILASQCSSCASLPTTTGTIGVAQLVGLSFLSNSRFGCLQISLTCSSKPISMYTLTYSDGSNYTAIWNDVYPPTFVCNYNGTSYADGSNGRDITNIYCFTYGKYLVASRTSLLPTL
jgi:hypothetical protein